MSEESMENFQDIHASVITTLRYSKTRVWSAGLHIFSQTPELQTRNSAGLQNSDPGIRRNPEFRISATRNSGGLRPESKLDLESHWNSPGIPGLFLLGKKKPDVSKNQLGVKDGMSRKVRNLSPVIKKFIFFPIARISDRMFSLRS